MTNFGRISLVVLVLACAAGLSSGCDAVEGAEARVQAADPLADLADLDVVVGLPPNRSVEPSDAPLAFAAPTNEQPISFGSVSPTDDLLIGWMRWAFEQPWIGSPMEDSTGEHCGAGQAGPIWYLGGTFGGPVVRDCDVPAGKQLALPVINTWALFGAEDYPTEASVLAALPEVEAWFQVLADPCELILRVDGQDVLPDLDTMTQELHIEVLEPFDLALTDDNVWAYYGSDLKGTVAAMGAGYYARLNPLPPGDHVIEFGGSLCGDFAFSTFTTYHLHVGN